jgi:DNA-binding phage protein
MFYFSTITTVLCTAALIGIFVIQLVNVTGGGLNHLTARLESTDMFFSDLMRRYPTGQLDTTLHQTIATVENMHKISAKVSNIKQDQMDRAIAAIANTDVQSIMSLVGNANRLLASVSTESVNGASRMVSQMNATKLNELVDTTRAIEERLRALHEIKISI